MRLLCCLAVALIALVDLASASVRPAAGTKFAGKTSQGTKIRMHLVKGGGLKMDFVNIATCNRGPKKQSHSRFDRDRPHVKSDGTFDYRKTYRNLAPVPGLAEPFDDIQHLHGVFGDRKHVTGYFEEDIIGRRTGLKCKVRLTFNAHRVK